MDNPKDNRNQNSGSLLNQKTNEDFNKKQPHVNDPDMTKRGPKLPEIGDDDLEMPQGEITDEIDGEINGENMDYPNVISDDIETNNDENTVDPGLNQNENKIIDQKHRQ